MTEIDALVSDILRSMGVDVEEKQTPHWIVHYYNSKMFPGEKYKDGFICSRCGKHSWNKKDTCDGCGSVMTNSKNEVIQNDR